MIDPQDRWKLDAAFSLGAASVFVMNYVLIALSRWVNEK